jgi:hypothetical protein
MNNSFSQVRWFGARMRRSPGLMTLDRRRAPFCSPCLTMPHKYNADRRHRIPRTRYKRTRYKVTNWRDYEAGLHRRGSLTIWFTEEAVAAWQAAPRATPGGQLRSRGRDSTGPRGSISPAAAADRRVGRLLARADEAGSASAGARQGQRSYHSTLSRRSRTLAVAPQAASDPVRLLVDSTGVRLSGVAGREARHPAPSCLEKVALGYRC